MSVGARILTACIATLAVARGAGAADIAALDQSWKWVTSDRFELLTNGSERNAKAVLVQLQSFRAALSRLNGGAIAEPPQPIRVLLFNRAWDFAPYQVLDSAGRPMSFSGYFVRRGDASYIVLSNESKDDVPRIVYHEFTHFLVWQQLGRLPTWLSEGLAEYFSGFRYLARSRRVEIGRPIAEHMQFLNSSTHLPLERVLEMTYDSSAFQREVPRALFYSKSWLLVHYLQVGSPERAGALARYAQSLFAGKPGIEAFESAVGCSVRALDDELTSYQRKPLMRFATFELEDGQVSGEVAVRPATRADVAYRLGEYLLALGTTRRGEAEAHFAASGRPVPSISQAYAPYLPEDGIAAAEPGPATADEIREALHANPQSVPLLSQLAGEIYRLQIGSASPNPEQIAEARQALFTAASIEPTNALLARDLSRIYRLDPTAGDQEHALEVLAAAFAAHPDDEDLLFDYAEMLERTGRRDEARQLADDWVRAEGADQVSEEIVKLLARIDGDRAIELAREGRVSEAEALLLERIEATPRLEWRDQLKSTLEKVRASGEYNRARETYGRAVQLTQAGRYDEAVELLRQLVASNPPKAVDDVARKALAQLEEALAARRRKRGSPPGPGS